MNAFNKWFQTFLDEKNLSYRSWEITDAEGTWHLIDSDVVIEAIKNAPAHEQKSIKSTIVRIDFVNGDVLDFFHHLAKALVAMRLAA